MKPLSNGETFLNQKYYTQFISVWRGTLISALPFQPEPNSECKIDFSLVELKKQLGMLTLGHFSSLWIDEAECILLCSCCRGQPHMPQDQDLLSGSSSEAPSHSVWGLIKQYKATVLSECACFGKTIPDFPIIKIIFHSLYF